MSENHQQEEQIPRDNANPEISASNRAQPGVGGGESQFFPSINQPQREKLAAFCRHAATTNIILLSDL